jgi:hypothetical protein
MGVETVYLGREANARRIADAVADHTVDAVELIVGRDSGVVPLLRQLLRALIDVGRRDVSIVLHRVHRGSPARGANPALALTRRQPFVPGKATSGGTIYDTVLRPIVIGSRATEQRIGRPSGAS